MLCNIHGKIICLVVIIIVSKIRDRQHVDSSASNYLDPPLLIWQLPRETCMLAGAIKAHKEIVKFNGIPKGETKELWLNLI